MFEKLQNMTGKKPVKILFVIGAAFMVLCSMFVTSAFAVDGTAGDMTAQEAAQTIFETVSGQINVGTIVGVIGIALGAGLALYFAWWGIRKVSAMVRRGLNGKAPA